jgi:hypothetical protein
LLVDKLSNVATINNMTNKIEFFTIRIENVYGPGENGYAVGRFKDGEFQVIDGSKAAVTKHFTSQITASRVMVFSHSYSLVVRDQHARACGGGVLTIASAQMSAEVVSFENKMHSALGFRCAVMLGVMAVTVE